jgi:hypothetical protein
MMIMAGGAKPAFIKPGQAHHERVDLSTLFHLLSGRTYKVSFTWKKQSILTTPLVFNRVIVRVQ